MPRTVVVLGTLDTKGRELAFLRDEIAARGVEVIVVDCGIFEPAEGSPEKVQFSRFFVAKAAGVDVNDLASSGDRGAAILTMAKGATIVAENLLESDRMDAIGSLGGSGGSSLACHVMRALPIGLPKLVVSTMGSGDTRPYVGGVDITVSYSVVDISGFNSISSQVIRNAAAALAGMSQVVRNPPLEAQKPAIAMSMFGVTTDAATTAQRYFEKLGACLEIIAQCV